MRKMDLLHLFTKTGVFQQPEICRILSGDNVNSAEFLQKYIISFSTRRNHHYPPKIDADLQDSLCTPLPPLEILQFCSFSRLMRHPPDLATFSSILRRLQHLEEGFGGMNSESL